MELDHLQKVLPVLEAMDRARRETEDDGPLAWLVTIGLIVAMTPVLIALMVVCFWFIGRIVEFTFGLLPR